MSLFDFIPFGDVIVTALATLFAALWGRASVKGKQSQKELKKRQEADSATAKERSETSGLSDGDIRDRVRGRDDAWRGMR